MKTACLSLIILACSSCHEISKPKDPVNIPERSYPHEINISEGFKNSTELKLSTIADSIRYIILSKDKEVIIKFFPYLQMTDNCFYINPGGLLQRFDLSGKYLNTIGKIGRGPSEYPLGSPFALSPSSDIVYIRRNYLHDYISFRKSGDFIGKVSLMKSSNVWDFVCFSDSIFMYNFYYMGGNTTDEMILCGIFGKDGNKIKTVEHPANKVPPDVNYSRLGILGSLYTFYDSTVVLSYAGDTVYKIDKNSIIPGFVFKWGNVPHPETYDELFYIQKEPVTKAGRTGMFIETSGEAYFKLKDFNDYYLFEYDKITGITKSMLFGSADKKDTRVGFINDIDGGVNYYPKWTNRTGDIWIDYDEAIDFKNEHSEDFLSKSNAVYPERKENLIKFLGTLNIDDNPVLKVVYLKKKRD